MDATSQITEKLQVALNPSELRVINFSHEHAGHAGSPGTGNSHFRIEIRAEALEGLPRVRAHQAIYAALEEEMKSFIHALEIVVV